MRYALSTVHGRYGPGSIFEDYCAEDHHDTEVFEKRMLFFSADVHYDLRASLRPHHRRESGSLASLSKRSSFNISSISVVSGHGARVSGLE
jgi:hypothetical protein